MGDDCSLHLVDERSIARELVPRLLGKSRKPLAFEQKKKGAVLLRKTREALANADSEEAARALTVLAIQFASVTLPHVEARGSHRRPPRLATGQRANTNEPTNSACSLPAPTPIGARSAPRRPITRKQRSG